MKINAKVEEKYFELTNLTTKINTEKNIRDSLLYNVIPSEVAQTLKQGRNHDPTHYINSSVMFIGIYNFTLFCDILPAIELARLVSDLYLMFDFILKSHKNVFKVIFDTFLLLSVSMLCRLLLIL